MAHDEMKEIRDLDMPLLGVHKNRLWFYFAEQDDWVGDQKDVILRSFKPDPHNITEKCLLNSVTNGWLIEQVCSLPPLKSLHVRSVA
ncbi:hypothetical protein DXG03_008923 [Asterophora parasitica]|uniref:Uncharacterized protein n=1 Tax=Asterophora parasitica TaxID=117018 RepID=A0A9P7GDZ4_9AGAR|nr:hypothetical protein DXG03_008923 [Asterophora parasitica]